MQGSVGALLSRASTIDSMLSRGVCLRPEDITAEEWRVVELLDSERKAAEARNRG